MTDVEQARLAALHEYRLLDAPADDELEAVVRVAALVAGVPAATLNLIDENRQCQLTTTGFEGADSPRTDSMCAVHFESGEFLHLPDASAHPAFRANPWVTGILADVRFYASFPLVTPQGHALGTLCVFDSVRHELTDEQIARLRDLAGVILALFERRRQARINGELLEVSERQRVELERSNAELENFAGVVSHDLAAPLGVVGGYLELLSDQPAGGTEPTAKWISAATRAVGRMQSLIESLLTYAQAGKGPCRFETAALGDLADQALMDLRETVRAAGATVLVPCELPTVVCDPVLIRQLLQNLISNAVKYRHPDRPCMVTLAAHRGDGEWVVTVTDNGLGIPDEHRDRIFEMFARIDRGSAGHGVGLATCQRIVDRHGGRISASAGEPGGTVITFTLPDAR